jgi:hypothetical protein
MAALLLSGCGSSSPTSPLARPTPTVSPAQPSASVSGPPPARVVVIVMENHSYDSVIGLPYIKTLASTATVLTDYHASGHPSLPNYLALTSGSTWGISDDGYHVLPAQDVGDQLTASGVPWRAYMEGMGSDCKTNAGGYAVKHDPFAYYGGRCLASVVPFTQFPADLAGATPPRFMWITPNLCHDMHDCGPAAGDRFLARTIPPLLRALGPRGLLLLTWDEGSSDNGCCRLAGGGHIATIVAGPVARAGARLRTPTDHYSVLQTIEDLFGLPRMGGAGCACTPSLAPLLQTPTRTRPAAAK